MLPGLLEHVVDKEEPKYMQLSFFLVLVLLDVRAAFVIE
jgi:hypothetical protein